MDNNFIMLSTYAICAYFVITLLSIPFHIKSVIREYNNFEQKYKTIYYYLTHDNGLVHVDDFENLAQSGAEFALKNIDNIGENIYGEDAYKIILDDKNDLMFGVGNYVQVWRYIPLNKKIKKDEILKLIIGKILTTFFYCAIGISFIIGLWQIGIIFGLLAVILTSIFKLDIC